MQLRRRDATTVSEHVVKTRPGATIVVVLFLVVVVYRVYTLRFSCSLSLSLSLLFHSHSLDFSVRQRIGLSLYPLPCSVVRLLFRQVRRKRLEDHTPVRLASIVLAIKAVVLTPSLSALNYNPFFFLPSSTHRRLPPCLCSLLSPFVAKRQVQFAQIQIYPRVTFPRGAN